MYVKEQISIWSEGSQIAANNRGSERFSQGFSCGPVHHLWMRGYQGAGIKTRSQSSLCLRGLGDLATH